MTTMIVARQAAQVNTESGLVRCLLMIPSLFWFGPIALIHTTVVLILLGKRVSSRHFDGGTAFASRDRF